MKNRDTTVLVQGPSCLGAAQVAGAGATPTPTVATGAQASTANRDMDFAEVGGAPQDVKKAPIEPSIKAAEAPPIAA